MKSRHAKPRLLLRILCIFVTYPTHAGQDIDPAPFLHRPEVKNYVNHFTSGEKKLWLESVLAQSIIYNDYVSEKIAEYALPEALKYLPVIESGYNPNAVSPSGATGLWQFMLNSIEPYDLQVNDWMDERRDFWKSTVAGLQKLAYNRSVLGDWLLALAAYNCGLNRVRSALEESASRDFWELAEKGYLPEETEKYIPKFLAIVHIAQNAKEYGLQLPAGADWKWHRMPVSGQVNLKLLTQSAGVPLEILALGNAELRYHVTPPAEYPYHLKVPDIYSDAIDRTLRDGQKLSRFYVHNIQPGDTLYALAGVYGVPVDLIRHHNPGIEPRYLRINTKLVIPAVKELSPLSKAFIAPLQALGIPADGRETGTK